MSRRARALLGGLILLGCLAAEWYATRPPTDLEDVYPVSYRACLERGECR